jgi:tRNA(Met) cytidine acetyltransferase
MEVAERLRREALPTNERRLLVLAGTRSQSLSRSRDILDALEVDPADAAYVGPDNPLDCRSVSYRHADRLMGTTQELVILDCHERCEPNVLGQVTGTVDGGGLLVLLTPPLDAWPEQRDAFDETLAVPPFAVDDVSGRFRQRLVETVRAHRGIAIVDVDSGTVERDGLTNPAPRLVGREHSSGSARHRSNATKGSGFPAAAYEACLTGDQAEAVEGLEQLRDPGQAVVVEAHRGRGKSSAAGIAAACLAAEGHDVLVTAPGYRNAAELFERAVELLETMAVTHSVDDENEPKRVDVEAERDSGCVRFSRPTAAAELPGDPDRVIVDEAAALPVRLLESLLAATSIAFTTTVHGYEGAGRGFSVRFRDHLAESESTVTERWLSEPIRFAPADPVEVWSFRALGLDAGPPPDQVVADATPETVQYRKLDPTELLDDEHLLREVFGLLVLAHYRTEPDDFARLLDAPNVSVHALLHRDHVVSVALLVREGGLPADLRSRIYDGERVRGNLIPDLLTSQLRDEAAGEPAGARVMRIATHSTARERGLGSQLLAEIRGHADEAGLDWVGVGFGATPDLVSFWRANGYRTVHLGISRNERSGEHSVVMLHPLSPTGEQLHNRHTRWFLRRFPDTLANALSEIEPDNVRAVCRSIDGTPAFEPTDCEWRILEGIPSGTAIFDTAPGPVTLLAFRYLTDGSVDAEERLAPRQERLLVRKTVQAHPWDEVAAELDYVSASACMRALGECIDRLLSLYGRETGSVGGH